MERTDHKPPQYASIASLPPEFSDKVTRLQDLILTKALKDLEQKLEARLHDLIDAGLTIEYLRDNYTIVRWDNHSGTHLNFFADIVPNTMLDDFINGLKEKCR